MKKLFIVLMLALVSLSIFVGCQNTGTIGIPSISEKIQDPEALGFRLGKLSYYYYSYLKMSNKQPDTVAQIEKFWQRLKSTNDVPSTAVICETVLDIASNSLASNSNTLEAIAIIEGTGIAKVMLSDIMNNNIDTAKSDAFIKGFTAGVEEGLATYKPEDIYEKEVDSITPFECNSAHCEFSNYRQYTDVIFQDATAKKLLSYEFAVAVDKEELTDFRTLMRHYHDKGMLTTKLTIDAAVIEEINGKKTVTKVIFVRDTGAKSFEEQIAELKAKIDATTDELSRERNQALLDQLIKEKELGVDPKYITVTCIRCEGDFPRKD